MKVQVWNNKTVVTRKGFFYLHKIFTKQLESFLYKRSSRFMCKMSFMWALFLISFSAVTEKIKDKIYYVDRIRENHNQIYDPIYKQRSHFHGSTLKYIFSVKN